MRGSQLEEALSPPDLPEPFSEVALLVELAELEDEEDSEAVLGLPSDPPEDLLLDSLLSAFFLASEG